MIIHNKKKVISLSIILIIIILSIIVLATNQQLNDDVTDCVITDAERGLHGCGFAPCYGDDAMGAFCFCNPAQEFVSCLRKTDGLCPQGMEKEGEPNFPTELVYSTEDVSSSSMINYDFLVLGDENYTTFKILYGREDEEYQKLGEINLKDYAQINIGRGRVTYFFESNEEDFILNFVIFDFQENNQVGYKTISYVYKYDEETKTFEKTNAHDSGNYKEFLGRSDRRSISDFRVRQVILGMYEHNTALISVRKDEPGKQTHRIIKLEFEKDGNELKSSGATISNEFELNRIEHERAQEQTDLRDNLLNIINQKVSAKEDFTNDIIAEVENTEFFNFNELNLTVIVDIANTLINDDDYKAQLIASAQQHENIVIVFNAQQSNNVFFDIKKYEVPNIFYYIHQNSDEDLDYEPHIFILRNTTIYKPFHEQHQHVEMYSTSIDSFTNLNFEKRENRDWAVVLFPELLGAPRHLFEIGTSSFQMMAVFGKNNGFDTDLWFDEDTQLNQEERVFLLAINRDGSQYKIEKLSMDLNLENHDTEDLPQFDAEGVVYTGLDKTYFRNFHLSTVLATFFYESEDASLTSCFVEHEGEIVIDACRQRGGNWHKTTYYDKSRPGYRILFGTIGITTYDRLDNKNIADRFFIHNGYECLIDASEIDRCGDEMQPMCAWGCKEGLSPCGFGICMSQCERGIDYNQFTYNSETGVYEIRSNEEITTVNPLDEEGESQELQGSGNLIIHDIRVTTQMGYTSPIHTPSQLDPNRVRIEDLNQGYFFNVLIRGATCGQDSVDLKLVLYKDGQRVQEIGSARYNNNFVSQPTNYLTLNTGFSACARMTNGEGYDLNYRFNVNNHNTWMNLPQGNYQLKAEVSRTNSNVIIPRFWWQGRGTLSRGDQPAPQETTPTDQTLPPTNPIIGDDGDEATGTTSPENTPGYGEGEQRGPFILGGCDSLANGHRTILFKNPYGPDACLLNRILPSGLYKQQPFDEIEACRNPTISQLSLLYSSAGVCRYFPNEPICNMPTDAETLIWSSSCKIIQPAGSPGMTTDLSGCEVLDITRSGGAVPIQGRAVTRYVPMHISRIPYSLCVIGSGTSSSGNIFNDFFTPTGSTEDATTTGTTQPGGTTQSGGTTQTGTTQQTPPPQDDVDDPVQRVYPDGNIMLLKTTDIRMTEQGFNTVCVYFNERDNRWRYVAGYEDGEKLCPIREQGSTVGLVDNIVQIRLSNKNYEEGLNIMCSDIYKPDNMITDEVKMVERLAPCS